VNPNDFIRWMLKSPFHGLLRNTMLITVTGRRTGRQITTPVSYTRDGQVLWIVSSRSRTWWRNILQTPKVRLRLHGREVDGSAEVVSDEAAVEERLAAYVHQVPAAARGLRLQLRDGAPLRRRLLGRACGPWAASAQRGRIVTGRKILRHVSLGVRIQPVLDDVVVDGRGNKVAER
jgi:deazaflavin-dependent oxidoreductase (nitroreductase family)